MSEAVSALKAAEFTGGIAEVTLMDPIGMISVRGDRGVAWMSPDELLLLCPYDQVSDTIDMLTKCFGSNHTLAVNVSDARAVFRISGAHSRDVLAKLAPVDLSPATFTPGWRKYRRRSGSKRVTASVLSASGRSRSTCMICLRSRRSPVRPLYFIAPSRKSLIKGRAVRWREHSRWPAVLPLSG